MASSSTSKATCATCGNKGVGIFKCEGCAQVFCRKHVIEHRDILSNQLDEIVVEYDTLQQTIVENKNKQNHRHPLIKQIDKWERDSIVKIQQTAEEVRQQINQLINSQKEIISNELYDLAKRLQKAREDDDYIETDLRTWTDKLKTLKNDVNVVPPSISILEDSTKVFIRKMYASTTRQTFLVQEEQFGNFIGDIHIEDNGRMALYSGTGKSDAYVRGTGEYSKGKHQIRFRISKDTAKYVMSFNIVSSSLSLSKIPSYDVYPVYGWETDDDINSPDAIDQLNEEFTDLKGETEFELEFTIDCDNRKISYFNERTRQTREMKVDIDKCPFPWQIEFYLFDVGDCVRILSYTEVFN